jgi:hypothetical protein
MTIPAGPPAGRTPSILQVHLSAPADAGQEIPQP